MADLPVPKRKRVAHSIELKLEILAKLDQGVKLTSIAKEYNIAKATVCEIKKGRAKIEKFASEATDSNTLKNRCVVRKAEDEDFDRALHQWFMQERGRGAPINGPTLIEKAKLLYEEMYPDRRGVFKASTGWLYRFKNRHGIRQLKSKQGSTLCVETDAAVKTLWDNGRSGGQGLSVQKNTAPSCLGQAVFDASDHFKHTMAKFVEENRLTPDQVFNADEVGLYWRLLPGKILSDGSARQQAKNVKASRDRVTLMAAANASGDLRLPLVFVHRSAKPSCFTSTARSALPCHYYSQSGARLDGDIFSDWFQKHFVPLASQYLRGKGLPVRAALLLDDVRSHPAAGAYVSETEDGSVRCVFVPSEDALVGAAVRPSVSETLKWLYKKDLLGRLLLGKQAFTTHTDFRKSLTLKDAVYMCARAWDAVGAETLRRAWSKLLLSAEDGQAEGDEEVGFMEEQQLLGLSQAEMEEWLSADSKLEVGRQFLLNEQLQARAAAESDNNSGDDARSRPIAHAVAMESLATSLRWLEQQREATPAQLLVLKELHSLATKKQLAQVVGLLDESPSKST